MTRERELRALVRAGAEIPHAGKAELILLTPDVQEKVMVDGREIQILDLKKWLIWGNQGCCTTRFGERNS